MPTTVLSNAGRVFPWLKNLSSDELNEFYTDFFKVLEQALQDKDWSIFEETIESWQATAEVLTDVELTAVLIAPSSDDEWKEWHDVEDELFDTNLQTGL